MNCPESSFVKILVFGLYCVPWGFGSRKEDRVQILHYSASIISFPPHCHYYLLPLHLSTFSARLLWRHFSPTQISLLPKSLFSDFSLKIWGMLHICILPHLGEEKWKYLTCLARERQIGNACKLMMHASHSRNNLPVKKAANTLIFCILISWPHNVICSVVNRALSFMTQRSLSSHRSAMTCQVRFIYWLLEIPKIKKHITKQEEEQKGYRKHVRQIDMSPDCLCLFHYGWRCSQIRMAFLKMFVHCVQKHQYLEDIKKKKK